MISRTRVRVRTAGAMRTLRGRTGKRSVEVLTFSLRARLARIEFEATP